MWASYAYFKSIFKCIQMFEKVWIYFGLIIGFNFIWAVKYEELFILNRLK